MIMSVVNMMNVILSEYDKISVVNVMNLMLSELG